CTKKAFCPIKGQSDGLLLQLNQEVPKAYRVYYNGWDRSNYVNNTDIKGLVGIHHPAGDAKKISVLYPNSKLEISTWTGGAPAAHYFFRFDEGDTEGGSSGSSIFANKNKYVIGTLTGGGQGTQYYGRLTYHWDKFAEKMGPFLDPKTNGKAFTCEGTYRDDMKPVYPVSDITVINGSNEKEFVVTWKSPFNTDYARKKYGDKCVSYMLHRNGVPLQMKRIYDDGSGVMKYTDKNIPDDVLKSKIVRYSIRVSYAIPKDDGGTVGFNSEEAAGMVQNRVVSIKPKSVSLNSQGTGTSIRWSAPLYPQEWSRMGIQINEYAPKNLVNFAIAPSQKLDFGEGQGQKTQQPYTYYVERWSPGILPAKVGEDNLSLYVSQLDFIPNSTQVGKNDLYIYLSYDKSVRDNSNYKKQVIQKVTVSANEVGKWKRVVFDKPIPLDPNNMLQVGFRSTNMYNNPTKLTYMSNSSDGDRAKICSTHMLFTNFNHYGEYYYTGEALFPFSFLGLPGVNLNYMAMKLIVTSSFEKLEEPIVDPAYSSTILSIPPVVTGYKVMKDGKEVAQTKANSLSFLDKTNQTGKGNYEIVPIYNPESLDTQLVSKAQMSKVVPTMVESTVTYSGDVADIAVYSMNGERVAFVANVENGGSIDLQTLEPGSYLVVMTTAEGKVEQKIVKK
ncbi:MAG: T9SS type A sorting domain-containing protein, partial [Porphyromonadaceae bacterium]|nr:T9SS type A sorting domain-containing protein [Porphyromonadaceae bacterium]